jgi:hypothetical protein
LRVFLKSANPNRAWGLLSAIQALYESRVSTRAWAQGSVGGALKEARHRQREDAPGGSQNLRSKCFQRLSAALILDSLRYSLVWIGNCGRLPSAVRPKTRDGSLLRSVASQSVQIVGHSYEACPGRLRFRM